MHRERWVSVIGRPQRSGLHYLFIDYAIGGVSGEPGERLRLLLRPSVIDESFRVTARFFPRGLGKSADIELLNRKSTP